MKPRVEVLGVVGDHRAPPGTRPWAEALRVRVQATLHDADFNRQQIETLTGLIRRHEGWRLLVDRHGRPFRSFEQFAKAPEPFGLGIRQLPEERQQVVLRPHGGERTKGVGQADNISLNHGTQAAYTTARLRRDRPDLAARVEAGELSPNRAAIEAGFRRPTVTVPVDVDRAVRVLARHFDPGQLAAALLALAIEEAAA